MARIAGMFPFRRDPGEDTELFLLLDAQGPGRMAQDCGNVTAVEPPGNAASARKEQEHGQRGNDNT